jgi:hypothetical protein
MSWSEADVVEAGQKTKSEIAVKQMDDNSPAALKLTVLNLDGSLWMLLSVEVRVLRWLIQYRFQATERFR